MALLRLTADNLAFVESELRKAYPGVKSSHLTEALAATLGSETHAALRVRQTSALPGAEDLAEIDPVRWRKRLTQLGHAAADFELMSAVVTSPALPDPCWRVFSKRDKDGMNDWFYYCQHRNLPYVFITLARKYADLDWDCWSVKPNHEGRVRGLKAAPLRNGCFEPFRPMQRATQGGRFSREPHLSGRSSGCYRIRRGAWRMRISLASTR